MFSKTGIGIMSGTSLDGLDLACCQFELDQGGWRFRISAAESLAYSDYWKEKLAHLQNGNANDFVKTQIEYSVYQSKACKDFIKKFNLNPDFISSHGHTIFHQPQSGFTCQILDGETMAAYLNILTVTQFRNKDVALGGQGAPLVPVGEKLLFPQHQQFLNLGGIANLSVDNQAFDVCVCNMGLNYLSAKLGLKKGYDDRGTLASSGETAPQLLELLNQNLYFNTLGPKSLGREWFEKEQEPILEKAFEMKLNGESILRTYVEHIAYQISKSLSKTGNLAKEVFITGGGAHNDFLISRLEAYQVKPAKNIGKPLIDFKEALIFAFLGLLALRGELNTASSVTGASQDCLGGSIHLPPNGGYQILH